MAARLSLENDPFTCHATPTCAMLVGLHRQGMSKLTGHLADIASEVRSKDLAQSAWSSRFEHQISIDESCLKVMLVPKTFENFAPKWAGWLCDACPTDASFQCLDFVVYRVDRVATRYLVQCQFHNKAKRASASF